MKTHAVSYLRVSGKGQIDGDGFDRQRDAIQRFAKSAGYVVVDEYRDEGVSGTRELESRPGLAAVLDRVEHNGVKVVIVERADRLARQLMTSEVIVSQFQQAGVRVLTADGADLTSDDDDPTRTLIRQVLAAVAQFDKSVTVLKLRAARERLRGKGHRVEGRKPYGFHESERAVIEQMQALRRPARGPRASYEAIAQGLNGKGITTRYGRPWTRGAVHSVLSQAK